MTVKNIQRRDGNIVQAKFGRNPESEGQGEGPCANGRQMGVVENLYRNHFTDLCRTLRRMYGEGPPEPEELAQQAFERIIGLETTEHIENPRAFLFRVAINLGLKAIRRVNLSRRYVAEQVAGPEGLVEEIDPERLYEGREKIRALDAAMASLTRKQREIVTRTRFYGQTYAEISKVKGWSQADISRQLNAALKVLAEAVEANEHEEKER